MDVLELWQELTAVQLTSEQRRQFLARREVRQLAALSHDRLRRGAAALARRPDYRPGRLPLTQWLSSAASSTNRSVGDDVPVSAQPFGARDLRRPPADRDLHRRIGLAQRPEDG